jgi:signal transduction histidine kinase
MGGLEFLGWLLNLALSRSVALGFFVADPMTAILFVLCGVTLKRLTKVNSPPVEASRDPWIRVFPIIVILISAIRVTEYLFGVHSASPSPATVSGPSVDGMFSMKDMSPATALNFIFCGLSLLVFDVETENGYRPAQAGVMVAAFIALLSLVGYSYGVMPLYRFGPAVPMSLNCAVAFELFSVSALAARPDRGVLADATSDTIGGGVARRLLPAAILIPLVLGGLCFYGVHRGYFEVEFGFSFFAVATMIVFTWLIWWKAKLLARSEKGRAQAERRLSIQYRATRALAESSTIRESVQRFLEVIADGLSWEVGAMWRIYEEEKLIRCEWVLAKTAPAAEFTGAIQRMTLPCGVGLPGLVWQKKKPAWIDNLGKEKNFPRAGLAEKAGLQSALAFPIQANGRICGVAEFFTTMAEQPDQSLLEVVAILGSQMGQFIERKRAEEQLRQASSELVHSNTELQQFAYVASHDLSEPLRMVVSYLQLLVDRSRDRLDAESHEFIGYAIDGAQRMQALIDDLLAYARVGNRGQAFEKVDCEQVFRGVLANIKVTVEESDAVIEHGQLPVVNGDPVQLTQVFQNLITNAIKFRGPAPPRIFVDARRSNGEWIIQVKDNGIGINPKDYDRVFVLFQRLHTRQEYPGTGMGLAICKKIIERHGGKIWVESKPGEGTTFYFTLPAQD